MMKPTTLWRAHVTAGRSHVSASAVLLAALAVLAPVGCHRGMGGAPAAASPAASPRPRTSIVERTTFAPALRVHLDSMLLRASGLYVRDLVSGTGEVARQGRSVVVRYVGWLPDGKQFDAGEITVTLGSNKTIPAWEEGLLGMRVGGRRQLVVPPGLGYGSRGAGDIPPNAVLVFDMELRSVL